MSKFDRFDLPEVTLTDDAAQALYDAIRDILIVSNCPPLDMSADDVCVVEHFPEIGEDDLHGLSTPEELEQFVDTHLTALRNVWDEERGFYLPEDKHESHVKMVQAAIVWACWGGRCWINNHPIDDY